MEKSGVRSPRVPGERSTHHLGHNVTRVRLVVRADVTCEHERAVARAHRHARPGVRTVRVHPVCCTPPPQPAISSSCTTARGQSEHDAPVRACVAASNIQIVDSPPAAAGRACADAAGEKEFALVCVLKYRGARCRGRQPRTRSDRVPDPPRLAGPRASEGLRCPRGGACYGTSTGTGRRTTAATRHGRTTRRSGERRL